MPFKRLSRKALWSLLLLMALLACLKRPLSSPSHFGRTAATGLSPNDIAILFKLPVVKLEEGELIDAVDSWLVPAAGRLNILPVEAISQMMGDFEWPNHEDVTAIRVSLSDESRWHVTAIRIGCLATKAAGATACEPTFRLVLQQIQWSKDLLTFQRSNNRSPADGNKTKEEDPVPIPKNAITTEDAAIHLFYRLDWQTMNELLDRAQQLKSEIQERLGINTSDFPLVVHPAFSEQAAREQDRRWLLGEMEALIGRYGVLARLHSAEVFVTSGVRFATPLPITWTFGTFRMDGNRR